MFSVKTHGHNIKDSNTYRIKMDVPLLNAALGISIYINIYICVIQRSIIKKGKWALIESMPNIKGSRSHKSERLKLEQSIFP